MRATGSPYRFFSAESAASSATCSTVTPLPLEKTASRLALMEIFTLSGLVGMGCVSFVRLRKPQRKRRGFALLFSSPK